MYPMCWTINIWHIIKQILTYDVWQNGFMDLLQQYWPQLHLGQHCCLRSINSILPSSQIHIRIIYTDRYIVFLFFDYRSSCDWELASVLLDTFNIWYFRKLPFSGLMNRKRKQLKRIEHYIFQVQFDQWAWSIHIWHLSNNIDLNFISINIVVSNT